MLSHVGPLVFAVSAIPCLFFSATLSSNDRWQLKTAQQEEGGHWIWPEPVYPYHIEYVLGHVDYFKVLRRKNKIEKKWNLTSH